MHVCIDATPLDSTHRFRGIGRYVQGLMRALAEADLPFPVTEVRRAGGGPDTGGALRTCRVRRPRWPRTRLQWLWNEMRLRGEAASTGCTLFHATDPQGITPDGRYRTVATAYDLTHLRFRTEHAWRAPDERAGLCRMVEGYRKADHLIAISEATKREFVALLGIPAERISVVPLAWDPERFGKAAEPEAAGILLPERFFLYAGAIEARKNVRGLVAAFARAKAEMPEDLVLTGKIDGATGAALARWCEEFGVAPRVHHIGFVGDDVLAALYRRATAFVFPTRYEGFGLPVLEAMGCGCPVLSSNLSCIPEIVGDAGVLVDPEDPDALAEGMRRLSSSESLRSSLREKGLRQAAGFTWERCAAETLAVYRAMAGMGTRDA